MHIKPNQTRTARLGIDLVGDQRLSEGQIVRLLLLLLASYIPSATHRTSSYFVVLSIPYYPFHGQYFPIPPIPDPSRRCRSEILKKMGEVIVGAS